ncbi:trypsin-like serine protease [Ferrovibrio sp.]|uniref:trypsin-like serine peptidase n=1 Tax=Ferrovibrio sp. TaxID=1917215 RepID=UPI00261E3CCF|nr:trypsin-like serine protease [Ferrovibrio sp.]
MVRAGLLAMADGKFLMRPADKAKAEQYRFEATTPYGSDFGLPLDIAKELSINDHVVPMIMHHKCIGESGGMNDGCITISDLPAQRFGLVVPVFVSGKMVCTGTYIAKDRIITAKHCLLDGNGRRVDKSLVAIRRPKETAVSTIRDYAAAEPNSSDPSVVAVNLDIAVLMVDQIEANSLDMPVLSTPNAKGRQRFALAGYGANTAVKDTPKEALLGVSETEPPQNGGLFKFIYDETLSQGSSGSCWRDSGGPVILMPINDNEPMRLVGLLHYLKSNKDEDPNDPLALCRSSEFVAVNFIDTRVRRHLCRIINTQAEFCQGL